jgi:hypothetical protein
MIFHRGFAGLVVPALLAASALLLAQVSNGAAARGQATVVRDPAEPPAGKPNAKVLPRPAGRIPRHAVDEKGMRSLISGLVACGTRSTLSSWDDPKRGAGCGRDQILHRLDAINKETGGQLQITVDKFEMTSERTNNRPAPLENVYAILPGKDAGLSKTVFIVSGHFDSIPSVQDMKDPALDAPGADDDASGVAVSMECARLLSKLAAARGGFRSTLLFAAVSGEEQGLLGSTHMVEWIRQQGYTVGGMLDDDIVGADMAPGGPHRVRLFSGNGEVDDADSPGRELARTVEEIDGRAAIRLIFRIDRYGRGGDHYPFYKAGLPAVRFTEPLENYDHEHQTPRTENGVEYGDYEKYLNFAFLGNVAQDNAEVLRELAMSPAPPAKVRLAGAVKPDARVSWEAPDDAERAGFEILWRETTEPRWQIYDFAEKAAETVLTRVSTDNHFFAVRAVGKNGARSIAIPTELERRPLPAPK